MPRRNLPYLNRESRRKSGPAWYVRIGRGPRLLGGYGSKEFMTNYNRALEEAAPDKVRKNKSAPGTLRWLYIQYRGSSEWTSLATATQVMRSNVLERALENCGHIDGKHLQRRHIIEGRERRKATPSAAK